MEIQFGQVAEQLFFGCVWNRSTMSLSCFCLPRPGPFPLHSADTWLKFQNYSFLFLFPYPSRYTVFFFFSATATAKNSLKMKLSSYALLCCHVERRTLFPDLLWHWPRMGVHRPQSSPPPQDLPQQSLSGIPSIPEFLPSTLSSPQAHHPLGLPYLRMTSLQIPLTTLVTFPFLPYSTVLPSAPAVSEPLGYSPILAALSALSWVCFPSIQFGSAASLLLYSKTLWLLTL